MFSKAAYAYWMLSALLLAAFVALEWLAISGKTSDPSSLAHAYEAAAVLGLAIFAFLYGFLHLQSKA